MNYQNIYRAIGHVDIYLIDQILKQRYLPHHKILDAGCGSGRNMKWFYENKYELFGIDPDTERIAQAKEQYPRISENLTVSSIDELSFENDSFDHIICCAVLHFAKDSKHFTALVAALIRVLKPQGSLFIRMASNIGLDGKIPFVQDGVTNQEATYFLTREVITWVSNRFNLTLLEPVKTTNVQDKRAMTTLVLQKP